MRRSDHLNAAMLSQFAPRHGQRELLPELDEKQQLALMCRMLYQEGWSEHIAGHITWRIADDRILVNPWELAWDEIKASDVITIDGQGQVIDSDWNVTPAIKLHLQMHDLRPESTVVIHHHAYWSGIWASAQRVPPALDQASCMVDGAIALYNEYEGQYDDAEATLKAARALGDSKWALLANHGALVVAENLRQAHLRVITLEWRSMRAWQAEQISDSKLVAMPSEQAASLGLADENGFPFLWEAMARRELRRDPQVLE